MVASGQFISDIFRKIGGDQAQPLSKNKMSVHHHPFERAV